MAEVWQDAWARAIRLLSQREHSRQELAYKLGARSDGSGLDADTLAALLDELEQAGYLNDRRYAEMLVRSLLGRGQGPMKIHHALRDKGVPAALASEVLEEAGPDWHELARYQREKKFGEAIPKDPRERARQSRFLAGRGFFIETINAVFHEKC